VPYYIYKIFEHPIRRLEKLEQHESYRDASASAKRMRSGMPEDAAYSIKMVFGETELHAEDALNQVREPSLEPDE
jgi:hypothetical protein